MILNINGNFPEIPEQFSSDVHALIFTLMDLIRRVYASREIHQDDPDKAVEATIAWGRERHPEILDMSPEEIAQILRHRGLINPRS